METVGNLRAEEILEALDKEQRAVALATRGPVCVIAGLAPVRPAQLLIASHTPQLSEQWIHTKFWHLPLPPVLREKCALVYVH